MTAEERARSLYDRLFRVGGSITAPVCIDPLAIIAQALRDHEDAAYERAAVHVEDMEDGHGCYATGGSVRSLKSKKD